MRIPFSRFRPMIAGEPALNPAHITEFGVRFYPPKGALDDAQPGPAAEPKGTVDVQSMSPL